MLPKGVCLIDIIFNYDRVLKRLAIISCLLLLAGQLSACSRLFFYPMKQHVRTPADIKLEYRDVTIKSSDGVKLHGWWLPAKEGVKTKGTVYFLHGNAENISTHIASVHWLPEEGYQVFLLDYRGYGLSTGEPDFKPVLTDIRKAWQWLLEQEAVKDKPLFILGQSLGASLSGYVVATQPELRKTLTAVVLDAGFASYPLVAKQAAAKSWLTWLLQWPVAAAITDEYNLEDVIANIQPTPLMLIHGKQDTVVSPMHVERLYERAGDPKRLLRYDGPHIATFHIVPNRQLLLEFFSDSSLLDTRY